jgi:hypothetical protein
MHRLHPLRSWRCAASSCALGCVAVTSAQAQAPDAASSAQLPAVIVRGNYDNAVGTSDAASQGTVTSKLIENRPTLRPAEVLEFVPGVIVTQHSGDGKANQYFLRGFNLDHGTDFATSVDGMPVNMPTHAHGHGYSDLNWLIPELVDRIAYRKGPYYAEDGDFASAGSARIKLFDALPRGMAVGTVGQRGYRRGLLADSSAVAGGSLLYAFEAAHNDGPWDDPERFRRVNGVLRYSFGNASNRSSLTAMAYAARWNATDQIPQRAVDAGLIGRFGAIDRTDAGNTARLSLSYDLLRKIGINGDDGVFKFNVYAIQSRLDLYSNFTYFLEHPVDGDQFQQAERRKVAGLTGSRSWNTTLGGRETTHTLGLQIRHDRLDPVGLYDTVARQRTSTVQESAVRQTSIGVHFENATQWLPWLRSVAGVRGDHFGFDVQSSIAANSGRRSAAIASPKLSLIFGPWHKTEYFANLGTGFHSNDARGTTATVHAKSGLPAERVDPLVRSKGAELGLRTEIIPGLQSSLALWQLQLGSELVFVGDAGETEPNRASKRTGIEWNNHFVAAPWLLFDVDLAVSRARFTQDDPAGNLIPGAIGKAATFGATVADRGPWFGQFQLRYFGPRALTEDNSQRSKSTVLASLRVGYKISKDVKLAFDVFNLFNRSASDIDYFYTSRLRGEPTAGVADIHFHPVEPRAVRFTVSASF